MIGCGGGDSATNANGNRNAANMNAGNMNGATTNGSPARDGVIDTNANIRSNANGNTVSSNTAVVTNNNGNTNTSGVKTTNDAGHGKTGNANH
jgi:hypothetical protein